VGNAGNITAYWKGFKEYRDRRRVRTTPRMWGCQASGANACVLGRPVLNPETVATAIRIGNPASMAGALAARDDSDDWILHAYREIALAEGLFCEPASAAAVAGVWDAARRGELRGDETVVCVLTGNGLKDPERAIAEASPLPEPLPADERSILARLGLD
jgi:threonine synthase